MNVINKQKERVEGLLQLIQENPDLPIVPMVDYEIIASDDYTYWTGSWGKAAIDEVYIDSERIYFKSTDEDLLADQFYDEIWDNVDQYKDLSEHEIGVLAERRVEELNWKKAIVVYITLPDNNLFNYLEGK